MVYGTSSFGEEEDDPEHEMQPLTGPTAMTVKASQNRLKLRQLSWSFDPTSPLTFTIVTFLTFLLAISYLTSFEDEDHNVISRAIHKLPFMKSQPVSWEYENQPLNHHGIMVLGAPHSRNSLLTALLSSSGYRLISQKETLSETVVPFHNMNYETSEGQLVEPLMRKHAIPENEKLLQSQDYQDWKDKELYKINSTELQERIHHHHFLKESKILDFWANKGFKEETNHNEHHPWIWHDPHLCMTFPAWMKIYKDMKFDHNVKSNVNATQKEKKVAVVFSYRDPMEVAQSLHSQYLSSSSSDTISMIQGMQLWIDYNHKCLSNIQKYQHDFPICPIFLSEEEISNDPQTTINSLLDQLDEKCGIVPGLPGRLGSRSAQYNLDLLNQFEEELSKVPSSPQTTESSTGNVILNALGVKDLPTNCQELEQSKKRYFPASNPMEETKQYEWGSEALTNAINELISLQSNSRGEERKAFLEEKLRLQSELVSEIQSWVGKSTDTEQFFRLSADSKFMTVNATKLSDERTKAIYQIRTDIQRMSETALQLYCDLKNGEAFEQSYKWPLYKMSSLRNRIP